MFAAISKYHVHKLSVDMDGPTDAWMDRTQKT